jgi:hypothetical protein
MWSRPQAILYLASLHPDLSGLAVDVLLLHFLVLTEEGVDDVVADGVSPTTERWAKSCTNSRIYQVPRGVCIEVLLLSYQYHVSLDGEQGR